MATSTPARRQTSQVGIALAYSIMVSATCLGTLASGDTSGSNRLLCATMACLRARRLFLITNRLDKHNGNLREDAKGPTRGRLYAETVAMHDVVVIVAVMSQKLHETS